MQLTFSNRSDTADGLPLLRSSSSHHEGQPRPILENSEDKIANLGRSLGSPANDDAPTEQGPFVGDSLCGEAFSVQDFAPGANDVTGTGGTRAVATEFSGLPPPQRIQRYLLMAEHARWNAGESKDASARQSYLFIAEQWGKLALDLARHSARWLQIDMTSKPDPKR